MGLCPSVTNTGSTVEVGATRPGGGGTDGSRSEPGRTVEPPAPAPPACDGPFERCREYEVVLLRATLADVATFAPTSHPLTDEPDGVGIVGMPVNFVIDAETHTVTGSLFDLPVSVRFTPVGYTFDHGDGTTRTSTTGGASWAALGVPQFTATSTSHAYAARGTFTATTTVQYVADVDFGTGWSRVAGTLTTPGGSATVQVVEARTALVAHTCLEDPGGPGC